MPWFLIFMSTDSETRKLIFILKFISASDDKNFYLFEKKKKRKKKVPLMTRSTMKRMRKIISASDDKNRYLI